MNLNRFCLLLVALVAVLSLGVSACGSDATANGTAVATVGAETLTQEDFEAILQANGIADTSVVSSELSSNHISEWIFFESWIDLAEAGGTDLNGLHLDLARVEQEADRAVDPSVPTLDSRYGQITQRYRAVPHLVADHVMAIADVTALCSSHLIVDTETEAEAAIARFEAGEDFAALAAEISIGPSGPTGGDLGCVAPHTFVAEFVDGAAEVGGSGISDPVQSQFGWHVILVRSFGPLLRGEHEELTSEEITSFVLGGYGAELQQLQAELHDRDISVDPRFGIFDASTGQVVPDAAPT